MPNIENSAQYEYPVGNSQWKTKKANNYALTSVEILFENSAQYQYPNISTLKRQGKYAQWKIKHANYYA